jgi:betaine-aldehyde dehydrogenase
MKMQTYKMLIDGKWVNAESDRTYAVLNPATEEEIARVALGGKADVDKAVAAARKAFPLWSQKTQEERTKILRPFVADIKKYLPELAKIDVLDHGTPFKISQNFCAVVPHLFEYSLDICTELMGAGESRLSPNIIGYLKREPIGVCALITPWNVPIMIAAKLAPAIIAGNTVVMKPPSVDSLSTIRLAEILSEYLPTGVINLVTGPGETVGEALAAHPGVNMIAITGSSPTGQEIMATASKTTKRLYLELGGKNPFIVLADADIDAAVANGVYSITINTGMICTAPGRFYVHEKVYDKFIEKFVAEARKMVVGDPNDEKTQMGPVVSAEHRDRVEKYINIGVKEGAKLVLGGQRPTNAPLNKGYYIMPAVLTDITQNMRVAREEIFGPVACILKFSSEDEVIKLANDNNFGLAGSVWTRNLAKGQRFADALEAGTVWINRHGRGGTAEMPSGGFKESGFGKERSVMGQLEYTQIKSVFMDITNNA